MNLRRQRLTVRPFRALLLSPVLAVLFTWAGLTIGYYTPYPVSFLITTLAFGTYVAVILGEQLRRHWLHRAARASLAETRAA